MKKLFTAFTVFFCFCNLLTFAQNKENKSAFFDSYPSKIVLQESQLAQYFTKKAGEKSDVSLTNSFRFAGDVSSNIQKYHNLQSVVVKSSNFPGALMQVTKIINPDNSISYSCHIIGKKMSDGYEMKPSGNGSYVLTKVQARDLLQDCNL